MNTWIALLRGVNVGGHKNLPMAEFRGLLGDLGFEDAATYLQSGNAVFRANGTSSKIAANIAASAHEEFGYQVDVFVQSLGDLQDAVGANPFPQAEKHPKSLHLFFLAEPVDTLDVEAMKFHATRGEEFHCSDKVFYLYAPNGFGQSELAAKLGRFIKTSMTGRNLRTCHQIIELANAL
ncbi:MAG: DUF1697 domain-containing protein [Paracoccaceae bacterium]